MTTAQWRRIIDVNLTGTCLVRALVPLMNEPGLTDTQAVRDSLLVPGEVHELRVELLPMSFFARRGDRIRLEITHQDSLITGAPMTYFYGTKATDTYHHDCPHPSTLRLHERPRT